LPPDSLRDLGFSLGLINIDNAVFAKDDVVRRAILTVSGNESIHLWTANKYRVKDGKPALNINDIAGAYYNPEADAKFVRFRYFTNPIFGEGEIKKIPYHRVAVGNFPPGYFKDKIVLIGPSYLSRSVDFALTPYNTNNYITSKMAIHASIIQSLIQNKTIYTTSRYFGYFVSIMLAVFLSVFVVRTNPARALYVVMGTLCIVIASSFALFTLFGIWLNTIHFILTIAAAFYIGIPFKAIDEYQRRFAIQEETKLLRKVENLKQNFISLMSHDLKTPVAKIAGLADTMRRSAHGNPEVEQGIESIVESTRELNNFITSILDLTKVESRNISLTKMPEDINSVIEQVMTDLRFETRAKGMKIKCDLAPLYPIQIDHQLMTRVVSNLVGNAIKYSGDGITVSIKTWDDEEWVYVEITDDGIGIPQNDLAHIFEKFYRVKNDANHSIKGSGLGLYLVKYFIELHGGTINAKSEVGVGTTFEIKLINA
ncbi:MAG: CHASE2 domain-containing protein, partial [Bacteriovoracaceae bacterium]|nr:CHASE2 domain-containing protein [Bacteriovoracaceae bacterium]